jgi:glycosyltransferase involved in cell wall biosynthesis
LIKGCAINSNITGGNVLVLGQVVTSRTETVEDYFKDRCYKLAIVGLAGIRQRYGGRCTFYKDEKQVNNFRLPALYVKANSPLEHLFTVAYYFFQSILIILSALRLKTRFNFVIGISAFYTFMGIILKRLKIVNQVIYYCLDYYPSKSIMNKLTIELDKFCYENSDIVWNLSSQIAKARINTLEKNLKPQKEIIVPLTHSSKLLTLKPLNEIDRWSIAFIGTIEKMQGLQLLVEAMPEILAHSSKIHVKIIGDGPYAHELKNLVKETNLDDHFTFYGFVTRNSEVIETISNCAIGVAPFIPVPENNAITADPGKIKFYASLGLPVIVTKIPSGLLIEKEGAGIAVDYEPNALANAVIKLLQDDQTLEKYRKNANLFAQSYTSERVFGRALEITLKHFQNKHNWHEEPHIRT